MKRLFFKGKMLHSVALNETWMEISEISIDTFSRKHQALAEELQKKSVSGNKRNNPRNTGSHWAETWTLLKGTFMQKWK